MNLVYILRLRPFESKFKNKMEMTNESLTLLSSYFVFCWQYNSLPQQNSKDVNDFKNNMSWCLIAIIFFAFILNLFISLYQANKSLIKDIKNYYADCKSNQKKKRCKER